MSQILRKSHVVFLSATFLCIYVSPLLVKADIRETIKKSLDENCDGGPKHWEQWARVMECLQNGFEEHELVNVYLECLEPELREKSMMEKMEHYCADREAALDVLVKMKMCRIERRKELGIEHEHEIKEEILKECKRSEGIN